mgnify:CR=1 FL=1
MMETNRVKHLVGVESILGEYFFVHFLSFVVINIDFVLTTKCMKHPRSIAASKEWNTDNADYSDLRG